MLTPEVEKLRKEKLFYTETLKSEECQCERRKQPGRAVCFKCWQRLPQDLQRALYKHIGNGFEQAYEEAYRFLNDL